MRNLRVVTYNIHKCRGMDGRVRPERIARVLEETHADLIALQEVLSHPDSDQPRIIAEHLKMDYIHGETRQLWGGVYGNTLLSRFPFVNHTTHDVSRAGREPRGILHADSIIEGRRFHIFNLHLGTGFFERRFQARAILERRVLHPPGPPGERIVLGDLNEWTRGLVTRTLMQELRRIDLEVPFFRRRYPGLLPLLHLDHIYFEHTIRPRDAFYHSTRLALVASDHLPLVADFVL